MQCQEFSRAICWRRATVTTRQGSPSVGTGLCRGRRVGVERGADQGVERVKQLVLVVSAVDLLHLGSIEAKKNIPLFKSGFGRMPSRHKAQVQVVS
jgi:hypothetical protein